MSGPNPTVWTPNLQEGEFAQGSSLDLADASGNLLVDNSSNNLVDDGATFTSEPTTTWAQNDTA